MGKQAIPRVPQAGFTLIEVLVTLAIMTALSVLTFVNLGRPQTTASLGSTVDTLVADASSERILAMAGDGGTADGPQPHGLRVQATDYTTYAGVAFDSQDANNFTVTPGGGIGFSTTFASGQVQFDAISGEVRDFDPAKNTITVTDGDETRTLTLNRFGVVTVQ
jgi:prepilin-type N-terminal cleavage/methylation domain-containing protein